MAKQGAAPFVSDHAGAGFAAAVDRMVRMWAMMRREASGPLSPFDAWIARAVQWVLAASADLALATTRRRRLDLNLHAPDATHIALAHRRGARLLTCDAGMAAPAHRLGIPVTLA
jgi:predicted nucleic acid-binding protein